MVRKNVDVVDPELTLETPAEVGLDETALMTLRTLDDLPPLTVLLERRAGLTTDLAQLIDELDSITKKKQRYETQVITALTAGNEEPLETELVALEREQTRMHDRRRLLERAMADLDQRLETARATARQQIMAALRRRAAASLRHRLELLTQDHTAAQELHGLYGRAHRLCGSALAGSLSHLFFAHDPQYLKILQTSLEMIERSHP